MNIKAFIPRAWKIFGQKVQWFVQHFDRIHAGARLQSGHYVGPITYDTDSLTTSNNVDFIKEPGFVRAYQAAQATNPWTGFTLQWRIYIVCWFANYVKQLSGDFVECGVNTGAYSRAVIEYIDFSKLDKTFYLFDTFNGFPESQITDAEREVGIGMYGGDHYRDVYNQVVETFRAFRVKLVKGRVPETLANCEIDKICYLSIDMNAVAPEIAAAEYFWPKLVKGGVLILDDYGFAPHINQKIAFDEFAGARNVSILSLPTGQGILFKP